MLSVHVGIVLCIIIMAQCTIPSTITHSIDLDSFVLRLLAVDFQSQASYDDAVVVVVVVIVVVVGLFIQSNLFLCPFLCDAFIEAN